MKAIQRDINYTVQKTDADKKAAVVLIPFINKRQIIPVRESLTWFSGKMEKELLDFDETLSAWETEIALGILDDLDEQVSALRSKLLMAMKSLQPKTHNAVIDQCVEVANLAHMIASSHHPKFSHYRNGREAA